MKPQFLFTALLFLFTLGACNQDNEVRNTEDGQTAQIQESAKAAGQAFIDDESSVKNILQIAINSDDHSTLVAGVQASELENVLANNGPLTVFAPNNEAFEALPGGTLDDLLKPENKSKLKEIITYHAAPGTYPTKMLRDGQNLFMATGDNTRITKRDGKTFVNGAEVLASVEASNGIVHVVDAVLLPPE